MSERKLIIILGSSGMAGHKIASYFKRFTDNYIVVQIDRECNYSDQCCEQNKIIEKLDCNINYYYRRTSTPNIYIINCLGVTNRSDDFEAMTLMNSYFPHQLEQFKDVAKVIHLTTDCVFKHLKFKYHNENSSDLNKSSEYGLTKYLGERPNNMNLRVSIIGEEINHFRNLFSDLHKCVLRGDKEYKGYINHYWNGMTTLELAKCLKKIVDNDWFNRKTYHLFSPTFKVLTTKYKLIELLINEFKFDIKLIPTKDKLRHQLLGSKHDLVKKLNILPIEEQIKEMVENLDESYLNIMEHI
jgi:dTDP-4-dehydrorhamnose reductase